MSLKSIIFSEYVEQCNKIFDELTSITCAFTGPRPQNLPWGFNENDERCIDVKGKTRDKIIKLIQNGYKYFIVGMAIGFDTMVAETLLELKEFYPQIVIIAAIPCKNQEKLWHEKDQIRYRNILKQIDRVVYVSQEYTKTCMLERNKYMVNNSSLLVALFYGKPGGTKNTIDYAKSMGLKIEYVF